jgi:hypothetical protein
MAVTDPRDYLDRRYENAQIAELPDAPIDALRGLGSEEATEAGAGAGRQELGVEDVGGGR